MRANGRSPTSAIAPPGFAANNKLEDLATVIFHCCHKDINRARLSHKRFQHAEQLKLMRNSINREHGPHGRTMGVSRTAFSSEAPGRWTRSAVARYASGVERHMRKADYFLLQDEEGFPFVCRSAGLNPEDVRDI